MTLKSGACPVKATSHSSTATHRENSITRIAIFSARIRSRRHNWRIQTLASAIRQSMVALALFHRRKLLRSGGSLVHRLPRVVRHAVDRLAALVLAHHRAPGVGFLLEPVGQAIATESGEIHQVDILHVGAQAQMFDEAAKYGRFQFRSGFIVSRHGISSLLSGY